MIQNTPKIPNYASLSGHTCVLQIKLTRIHTVPLNYNFISTRMYTRGTTRLLAWNMLKSRVEIIIYTRRGMPRHDTWYYMRRG